MLCFYLLKEHEASSVTFSCIPSLPPLTRPKQKTRRKIRIEKELCQFCHILLSLRSCHYSLYYVHCINGNHVPLFAVY